ncbi:MAG: hypothetical protein IJT88_05145 [Kiritimatiellae bacterium]|nr:hypothetical protein [Kiritimatiellia bacterium]
MAKNEQKEHGGLVFELENLALGARRIRYEVLAGIFQEQGIPFSAVQYSRYCLGRPDDYLPGLVEKVGYTAAPATMVAERLRGESLSRLMQKDCALDANLKAWLDDAKAHSMPIAAVTCLPQEAATSITKRLAFETWGIRVLYSTDTQSFRSPAAWLSAAQVLARHPTHCLALVTSASWARAALAASFKGIAIPDEFTEFENFAGMNYILSSLQELKADATFKKLGL